jgi:natural product biosynthesis luciferase-like monooxygenase protein
VALPLHHPLRVAEEWAVVDNLSRGRVDVSFTSGWIPNDFAIAPQPGVFARKRDAMYELLDDVQRLWQGGSLRTKDGVGNDVELRVHPQPIQPRLPVWITCSGDPAAFVRAGELGYNVLTALLTQPLEEAAEKAALYRQARARAGHDPAGGCVTLMMHTFVGQDEETVRAQVKAPLTEYLKSHIGLMKTMVASLGLDLGEIDPSEPKWAEYLASFAFERYYRMGSLIGTPEKCVEMVNRVKAMGFDEVACLIDFGVPVDTVLASLPSLHELKTRSDATVTVDRAGLGRWLADQLGAAAPAVRFIITDELPHKVARPIGEGAAPTSDIHERAQRQKDARARQKQLSRIGRSR